MMITWRQSVNCLIHQNAKFEDVLPICYVCHLHKPLKPLTLYAVQAATTGNRKYTIKTVNKPYSPQSKRELPRPSTRQLAAFR